MNLISFTTIEEMSKTAAILGFLNKFQLIFKTFKLIWKWLIKGTILIHFMQFQFLVQF